MSQANDIVKQDDHWHMPAVPFLSILKFPPSHVSYQTDHLSTHKKRIYEISISLFAIYYQWNVSTTILAGRARLALPANAEQIYSFRPINILVETLKL